VKIIAFVTGFLSSVATVYLFCDGRENQQIAGLFCFFIAIGMFEQAFKKEKKDQIK
jgi:hypothetical protein